MWGREEARWWHFWVDLFGVANAMKAACVILKPPSLIPFNSLTNPSHTTDPTHPLRYFEIEWKSVHKITSGNELVWNQKKKKWVCVVAFDVQQQKRRRGIFFRYFCRWCTNSVTRFAKISPLCLSFKSLWLLFQKIFAFGKILNLLWQTSFYL